MNLRLIVSLFLLSGLLVQADPINPPLGSVTLVQVTNVVTGVGGSNYYPLASGVAASNLASSALSTNGGALNGAVTTIRSSGWAGNELITADGVRGFLSSGKALYMTTNVFAALWQPTNTTTIGAYEPTAYSTRFSVGISSANQYIATMVDTNPIPAGTEIVGPATVVVNLVTPSGPGTSLAVKPEIYYVYDLNAPSLTLGDFDAAAQAITVGATNAYTWSIAFASVVPTDTYYRVYRLKTTAKGSGTTTASIGMGGSIDSFVLYQQGADMLGVRGATNIVTGEANGYDNTTRTLTYAPPVYLADGITTKKVGTTFSVADWIPQNLVDVYSQMLVHYGATSRGLLDGPGYLFNDQSGILPALSTNYAWMNVGYKNDVTLITVPPAYACLSFEDQTGVVITNTTGTNHFSNFHSNEVTRTASGHIGSGYLSDGIRGWHGNATVIASYDPKYTKTTNFSYFVWVKLSGSPEEIAMYGAVRYGAGDWGISYWALYATASATTMHKRVGTGNTTHQAGAIPVGTWVHLGVTCDATGGTQMYTNGAYFGSYEGTKIVPLPVESREAGWGTMPDYLVIGSQGHDYDVAAPTTPNPWSMRNIPGTLDGAVWIDAYLSSNEIFSIYKYSSTNESIPRISTAISSIMSLVCTNKVMDFLPTSTWMSILAAGSGLTTNDVQGYVSPDYGTNWYQASLVPQASIDLSNTLFQGVATYTNNVDSSNMVLKAVTTSNKVVKILGMWGPSN